MNSSSQEKKNKSFLRFSSIVQTAIVVIIGAVWPEKFG